MHDESQVCVAVVHFGAAERTEAVLAELRRMAPHVGALVVVDNGPVFDDHDWGLNTVRISRGSNTGYAGAMNQAFGFAESAGLRAVWILNNDTSIVDTALSSLLTALNQRPDLDVVGSAIVRSDAPVIWFRGGRLDESTGRASHIDYGTPVGSADFSGRLVDTDWVTGCSMLIPVDSWRRRGPFDEDLFLYKEELEWQLREPRAVTALVDLPLVAHEAGATTGSTEGHLGRSFMCRNALILALRQRGLRRFTWTWTWTLDFVARPIALRRPEELRSVAFALRTRRLSGPQALASL